MSDDPNTEKVTEASTDLQAEVDKWKALSRQNEERAKANHSELEAVNAQLSALTERAAKADSLAADLETSSADLKAKALEVTRLSLAVEFGLSLEDAELLSGDDETMRKLAGRMTRTKVQVDPLQGKNREPKPLTTRDSFTSLFSD